MNASTVLTVGAFVRQDQYNYYPSDNPFADFTPDLQTQTIGQNRRLTNAGARASVSYVKGIHNIKIGGDYTQTFITERDRFGIVDPAFNAPCLNADGSADMSPSHYEHSRSVQEVCRRIRVMRRSLRPMT